MKPTWALFLAQFFTWFNLYAQSRIDSLQSILSNPDAIDTVKINTFNALTKIYIVKGDYEKAIQLACEAIQLSRKSNGNPLFNKKAVSTAKNNIGNIYNLQGIYPEALKHYFESLKIREEIIILSKEGNQQNEIALSKKGIAGTYNNIGIIYYNQGNYEEALKSHHAALGLKQEIGDRSGIANSYNNIGIILKNQGKFQEALVNYFEARKILKALKDTLNSQYANTLNNIGLVQMINGDYSRALDNHFISLKIREKINEQEGMVTSFINLGEINLLLKKYTVASQYLNKGLLVGKRIGYKRAIKENYLILSELDSILGNYKMAYGHYKMYILYRDSLFSEETRKKTIESQMTYEFEMKEAQTRAEQEKKDLIATGEQKKQRLILFSTGAGLILMIVFAGFIFRSLKTTRKQKGIIEIARDELSLQKDVVEKQKEEIAVKNKDLTDSIQYAKRIQQAILTSEPYLNEMFLPEGQDPSYFVLYKPKDIVAGDFYWAFYTPCNKAIWVAADSTGHGVPGAFMSMIGNSLLNEIVVEKSIYEPAEILNQMRIGIIKALGQGAASSEKIQDGSVISMQDGMDAAVVVWNKQSNILNYAGANNSLWYIRNGILTELDPDAQPVGYYGEFEKPFTTRELQLIKGDSIYTFTDGYADQFGGPNGKKFKYKTFKNLLISIQNETMSGQKEILSNTIEQWRGNLEQVDDICVFGVRV